MTALICAFARAKHFEYNEIRIFDDCVAKDLLSDSEYDEISRSMAGGIGFFNPSFTGDSTAALRWAVDNQLSPAPLARAAFAESALATAVKTGARQYIIFACGYDSFSLRQPEFAGSIRIIEIDRAPMIDDRIRRINAAGLNIPENVYHIRADFAETALESALKDCKGFSSSEIAFCNLSGLCYYLDKPVFKSLLSELSPLIPNGSALVFDYPDENSFNDKTGPRAKRQALLANGAGEKMCIGYSYNDMEQLLSDCGFLIYEHLTPEDMTCQYFGLYNRAHPENQMTAFDNVNYLLAVKKD